MNDRRIEVLIRGKSPIWQALNRIFFYENVSTELKTHIDLHFFFISHIKSAISFGCLLQKSNWNQLKITIKSLNASPFPRYFIFDEN